MISFLYQGTDYNPFLFPQLLFHHFFLSTIEVFKVFAYNKIQTLIQSRSLVDRISNFEINPFVIKTAILVNKAALDDITKPALGFTIASVLEVIVEPPPIKISVIINNIFFNSKFCISPYNIHYLL